MLFRSLWVVLTFIAGSFLRVLTWGVAPCPPGGVGAVEAIRPAAGTYFAIVCAPTLFVASSIIFAAVLRAIPGFFTISLS